MMNKEWYKKNQKIKEKITASNMTDEEKHQKIAILNLCEIIDKITNLQTRNAEPETLN